MTLALSTPGLIPQLVGALDGPRVPVTNGSEASWSRDASGRLWVRKRESFTGFQGLLAESISHLMGGALGVRQPNVAVFYDGEEWSWMSEVVLGTMHWKLDYGDLIENPNEVAAMVVLDALTLNEDRHARNLLVQPIGDEAHLRIWAIDSGNALVGQPGDFIKRGDAPPDPYNHAPGFPVEALRPEVERVAARAARLPEALLKTFVAEGCALAREPNMDALHGALLLRCRQAPAIAAAYCERLGALS